mgnify:CR=1 FL=1
MSRIFYTATEARSQALQDLVILNEVRDLEIAIVTATGTGAVETEVVTTTTMAALSTDANFVSASEYYDTLQGTRDDRQKSLQISKVIKYFEDLGYTIDPITNQSTNTTFKWRISWLFFHDKQLIICYS